MGEHLLHIFRRGEHVYIFNIIGLFAVILTGGGCVRSGVLAEYQYLRVHESLLTFNGLDCLPVPIYRILIILFKGT